MDTTRTGRPTAVLTLAMALFVAVGWVQQTEAPPARTGGPVENVASVRWWQRPQRATTTVRPTTTTPPPVATTTTMAPAPAITAAPAPTTSRAPVTTTTRAPAPTTTAAPAPPPPPPATVAPPPPVGGLSPAAQAEMLALVNAKRATGTTCGGVAYPAVPPVSLHGNLSAAADAHARDMAANDFFSHTGSNGSNAGARMQAAGYPSRAWAENIAAGQPTPAAVIGALFTSAGHCKNFMAFTFTQIGFGKAENPSSTYRVYWVADLAMPG
jgi:uncharacterized protein YkwD